MDKIKQVVVSDAVQPFSKIFEDVYGLKCVDGRDYDPEAPCLFAGIYYQHDFDVIMAHKGKRMLVWLGTDAYCIPNIEKTRMMEDLIHVGLSSWIWERLERMGLPHKRVRLTMTVQDGWKPKPLGDMVYAYVPAERYGLSMVEEIVDEIDYPVLLTTSHKEFTKEEVREMYEASFIGLRLIRFDGCAATVQEMGMMGRRCVWNGKSASAIPWKTKQDVIDAVNVEAKHIGEACGSVADATKGEIEWGTKWLKM